MALEAVRVIGADIMRKRFVGIVAGSAGEACIAFRPTSAVFETIRGEAHVEDAGVDHRTGDDILPGAMTCATKIDGFDTGKLIGIENQAGAAFVCFGGGSRHMLSAGAMAGLAGHA